jgi:hypothetical protein
VEFEVQILQDDSKQYKWCLKFKFCKMIAKNIRHVKKIYIMNFS